MKSLLSERSILLRDAQPQDDPFLFRVYACTRSSEMALVDWPEETKEAFLRMQFAAQKYHYSLQFPSAKNFVILINEFPAGRLLVDENPTEIMLVDIALLQEFRGSGIGTALLLQLQERAAFTARTIRLHVVKLNPALHLYHRLGFEPTCEMGIYFEMVWKGGS